MGNKLMYNNTRLVVSSVEEQQDIIRDIHNGIGESKMAQAMASHRGRDSTYQKCVQRFFWHGMLNDVAEFVKRCYQCQQHGKIAKRISPELQSVPVANEVMKQIGIDICNLPEVDGYKHLIVCIDYFSKWSEAKPVKDKSAETVATFLYEIICRHGCMRIQINDQGKEFVNEVMTALLAMAGVDQRITSAYHPQANGLVERQNRTIKDSLVKVPNEHAPEWPYVIEGILFAHRVSKHSSTKFTPFFLMYNRHPILPIDLKYDLDSELSNPNIRFDIEAILSSTLDLRQEYHDQAGENITKAQKKQQRDYNLRHSQPTTLSINDKVWLKNQKREDRKGGKFSFKWLGPYTVENISPRGICTLRNKGGRVLSKKYNVGLLKKCFDPLVEPSLNPPNDKSSRCPAQDDERVSEKCMTEEFQGSECDLTLSQSDETNNKPSYFDKLSNELVEMILVKAVEASIDSFDSMSSTCVRFKELLENQKDKLLPSLHLPLSEKEQKELNRYNGKIKISTRKLVKMFGANSGVAKRVSEIVANQRWRSAWLVLESKSHSNFRVRRFFWKKKDKLPTESSEIVETRYWIRNDQYFLKEEDHQILLSKNAWLNDRIMDAAQKLICKTLGEEDNYQSVLNNQKKTAIPFQPVYQDHIQLLHDGGAHWFLSFCSSGRVQICDSLKSALNRNSQKSIFSLYKNVVGENGKVNPTFLPVQQQPDGFNCGVFAIAFAAEILDGQSPIEATFDVAKMRDHLIVCLQQETLQPFPKKEN